MPAFLKTFLKAFIGTGISGMDLVERNGGKIDLGKKGDYLAGL